ncbi:M48 family metallopeptidase [Maricaulis sp.]|uniref:M48 family metallopeptidase n=1 Tax=Maricaulis sp. TaxID=1486257 RepID=UPI002607F95B|nr:M48 family metallopeptidase [Maricaulis sp.]
MTPTGFDAEAATRAYIDSLGPEALERAAAYTTGNHWLMLGGLVVGVVTAWLIIRLGWLSAIERTFGERSNIGVFVIGFAYMLVSAIITLPWTIYSGWWREAQFDRTSQALGDFLAQSALGTAIGAVVAPIFLVLLYLFIRKARKTWWIWGGGLSAAAISLLMLLTPIYIMPLFNNYEPLPQGEVCEAVEIMAIEADIPTDRIFVFDGSRQSNNFTANVAGVGPSARIAISDIALGEASLDEVRAVTGHEVGHYVLGHVWSGVILASVMSVVLFFLTSILYPGMARLFGAQPDIARASGLPVLVFVISLLSGLAAPVFNTASRMDETAADQYSLDTVGLPDALASALVKTAEYRNPRPQDWEEVIFYTHPSVERRVRMAMEWKAENMAEGETQ